MRYSDFGITSVSDIFMKFKMSWLGTGLMTISFEHHLIPVISQLLLLVFSQIFLLLIDYLRNKYLGEKRSTKVKQKGTNLEISSEDDKNHKKQ